jgi:hypothetical protein
MQVKRFFMENIMDRNSEAFRNLVNNVAVGDMFFGPNAYFSDDTTWTNTKVVTRVDPVSTRFGVRDRVVYVDVVSTNGTMVEKDRAMWCSQLDVV